MQFPVWTKPALWGAVIGAVALAIVGFSSGWVVTNSTAEAMAARQADKAVIASLAPICVAQFQQTAQTEIHLAALQDENSWQRGNYVADRGWATMPGSVKPDSAIAKACAQKLMELSQ